MRTYTTAIIVESLAEGSSFTLYTTSSVTIRGIQAIPILSGAGLLALCIHLATTTCVQGHVISVDPFIVGHCDKFYRHYEVK